MCIYTENSDSIFFLGVIPLFELRNLTHNERYYSKQLVSATPLKPLNKITLN